MDPALAKLAGLVYNIKEPREMHETLIRDALQHIQEHANFLEQQAQIEVD